MAGIFESLVEASLLEGVAETIQKQIKAMDFWAFGSWGARKFAKSSSYNLPDENGDYEDFGPGLQFDVRGPKIKQGGRVYITLDRGRDLYTVIAGRRTRRGGSPTWITTDVVRRVPVENLIDVIDRIVG